MNKERLDELLSISTLIRNGVLCVILVVFLGFILHVMLSPADEIPAARDTRGGIPLVDGRLIHSTQIDGKDSALPPR